MKELFFSLISKKLFITLLCNDDVIRTICEDNYRKHSENFVLKIREIFDGIPFLVNDLDRVFFLTGPGGQTGERVSFSFVLGSLLSDSAVEVFSMDSLAFQATASKECLSIISVGEKSKRYHLVVYQDKKILFRRQEISEEELGKVKEMFPNLPVKTDFEKTDFLRSFLACKKEFKVFGGDLVQF